MMHINNLFISDTVTHPMISFISLLSIIFCFGTQGCHQIIFKKPENYIKLAVLPCHLVRNRKMGEKFLKIKDIIGLKSRQRDKRPFHETLFNPRIKIM